MRAGPREPLHWVLLAWGLGLAVAVLAYAAGPDRLVAAVLDGVDALGAAFVRTIRLFGTLTLDLVRGLAIGTFATFVLLCLLAIRRGLRGRAALGTVTLLWVLLVTGTEQAAPQERWAAALLLAGAASLVITRRILHTPPRLPGPP